MTEETNSTPPVPSNMKQLVPGYLLTPFGWASRQLVAMIDADPTLLAQIFQLSRPRMHLIALALAHLDGEAQQLAPVLFRASVREVLQRILGRSPVGITRVLERLPSTVLTRQSYQQLTQILDDPQTAKLLHHLKSTEITDATIRILLEVPAPLRTVALGIGGSVQRLATLAAGLRLLVSRGAAPTFDELVADLATRQQPAQFTARLRDLVASLPLPQTLPPERIAIARRLDSTKEVCSLAREWRNCLASRTDRIDEGQCAVYLWEDKTSPAVCEVARYGRLGWFFTDALGPRNRELDSEQLNQIRSAFENCGIPEFYVVGALDSILQHHPRRGPPLRAREPENARA
jgi:hypothetical protein